MTGRWKWMSTPTANKERRQKPTPRDNLTLTLSAPITRVGHQTVEIVVQAAKKQGFGATGGAVVLEDMHTGKILAIATRPSTRPCSIPTRRRGRIPTSSRIRPIRF